jgi:hypothetical protein
MAAMVRGLLPWCGSPKPRESLPVAVLVGNGIHSLNNPSVLAKVQSKEQEKVNKQTDDIQKKWCELLAQIEKGVVIRQEGVGWIPELE